MTQLRRNVILLALLGVFILAVLVAVPIIMGPENKLPADPPPEEPSVFARGLVDVISRVGLPVPKAQGIIAKINVEEGAEVKAGDPILELDQTVQKIQLKKAEAQLAAARQKLEQAKLLPNKRREELVQLDKALEIAETTLQGAKKFLEETKRLVKSRLKTDADVEQAEDQVKIAELNVERAKSARDAYKENDPTRFQIDEAEALYEAAEQEVKAARQMLENYVLRAPVDGYIENLNVRVGDPFPPVVPMTASKPPVVFLPHEGLLVRAELDQDRASMVKTGMRVTLQNYGQIDGPKWSGTVERLGRMYRRRQSVLLEAEMVNDARVLECVIKVDPEAEKDLLLGQQLRVQIHTGGDRP